MKGLLKKEPPKALIVGGVVVLLLLLVIGGYYAFNGGWKTDGQKDEEYKHTMLPLMAAKHGDTSVLEAENKLRQAHGQKPLERPKDFNNMNVNNPEKLRQLREQMQGKGQ